MWDALTSIIHMIVVAGLALIGVELRPPEPPARVMATLTSATNAAPLKTDAASFATDDGYVVVESERPLAVRVNLTGSSCGSDAEPVHALALAPGKPRWIVRGQEISS